MGGAKRYPSTPVRVAMGIASLHPSYENTLSRSRGALRPRFAINFPPSGAEGAGKTGCALHPRSRMPMHTAKGGTRAYRFSGSIPAFPAQWLYGLYVVSPVNGSFATVA